MVAEITGTAKEDLKTDLLIVGAGGAGLSAAVTASELGCNNIILLEKRSSAGGTSRLSLGILAAESPVQKRAMIDCSRDYCFQTAMDFSHWLINPRIVRAFIDKSGDTVRWLEEKGLSFKCLPFYLKQAHPTWHVPDGFGAALIKTLLQNCKDKNVRIMTNTSARHIISRGGKVEGVLAESKGKEIRIMVDRIILSTGGCAGNKEILKKYYPKYHDGMKCMGLPHTGDGLFMVTEIGAAVECSGTLLTGTDVPLTVFVDDSSGNSIAVRFMAFAMQPETLWVNRRGERFIDEGSCSNHFESPNAVLRQPGKDCFALFDKRILHQMNPDKYIQSAVSANEKRDILMKAMVKGEEQGYVKISGSLDEIAGWIGAVPEVLNATIEEYNGFCHHGHDRLLAKDREYLKPVAVPPYYAVRIEVTFVDTIGGIRINERMEVLDKSDSPIPGLYAAGVTTGGWEPETYCAVLSGSAFGFAVNSGRIAAENALTGTC